jgi:signal transduction histidine kinase
MLVVLLGNLPRAPVQSYHEGRAPSYQQRSHRVTTQIDRLQRTSRRMTLFWTIVAYFSLAYCLIGAFGDQPQLRHSWRGAALLLLAAIFVLWYLRWLVNIYRRREWSPGGWPPPWRRAIREWGLVFLLISLMVAIHPVMGWLFWCTFGMSFAFFKPPWMLIPAFLSWLGIVYTLLVTANPPPDAIIWIVVSLSLSTLAVGYSLYLMTHLLHQRYEREHVFTQLEDAHRQLAEAHRQLERSAERDAELAVLAERNRLARDMHDTIGHALVLIAVKLEAAQRLRPVNPARADHEIDVTKEVVRTTMSELRASLADLRTPALEQPPLGQALACKAREIGERAGFQAQCSFLGDIELSQPHYEALYRVAAEALTNVEKHAHAHHVTLALAHQQGRLILRIEDDGIGLPALVFSGSSAAAGTATAGTQVDSLSQPASPPGHYGITGMRERLEALSGTLALAPRPGGGTIVEATLPASQPAPED